MGGRTRGAPVRSRRVDMINLHVVYHRGCQRPAGASAVGRASALLRGSPLVPIENTCFLTRSRSSRNDDFMDVMVQQPLLLYALSNGMQHYSRKLFPPLAPPPHFSLPKSAALSKITCYNNSWEPTKKRNGETCVYSAALVAKTVRNFEVCNARRLLLRQRGAAGACVSLRALCIPCCHRARCLAVHPLLSRCVTAARCGFDLCHKYILYLYLSQVYLVFGICSAR